MKNVIAILSLVVSFISISQSNEYQVYQLDTKESIHACQITAYLDNIDLDAGYIEQISGSIISLRITKNTDYLIQINDTKYFKIYGSIEDSISNLPKVALVNDPQLIYRIQLGAFSKAIPRNYFNKFNDHKTEKIAGTNLTRFMIGSYTKISDVTAAQEQIKLNGFNDTFIVAYYNGERIDITEAIKMEEKVNLVENFELNLLSSNNICQDQNTKKN